MLSNSSKYAVKAVLYLAMNTNDTKRVMVKDIAAPINVPQAYIAKLLQELSRNGIISSVKGPKGGFYLSNEDRQRTLMEVINVLDDEDKLSSCVLSLEQCNTDKPCPLHKLVSPAKTAFLGSLRETTIEDFSNQIGEGSVFLPL